MLREDLNQVLVFNGTNNTQKAIAAHLHRAQSMTITYDRSKLLVACEQPDHRVFDLGSLQQIQPLDTRSYPQSIASSAKAALAVMRDGGGEDPNIHSVDLNQSHHLQVHPAGRL